jgi:hypothetical protein
MDMRASLKLAIGVAAAVPTLLAVGVPAGASTTGGSVSASVAPAGVSDTTAAGTLPRSVIAKGNVFKPTSLSGAGTAGKKCSKKTAGVIVANKTTTPKQLTLSGKKFGGAIPTGGSEYICYLGNGHFPPPATATFGLKGHPSTLTISFT